MSTPSETWPVGLTADQSSTASPELSAGPVRRWPDAAPPADHDEVRRPASGRVLVCDDRCEVRDAIELALRSHPVLRLVGQAEDASSCLREIDRCRPDLLILDVNMPGGGPSITRELRRRWPGLFILVYSSHGQQRVREQMLDAGADQFVLKTGRLRPLLTALAAAA
ncbi:response regulator [Nakamurella flava]|nr:response regulator transcription factor [Nakamurella flava]